MTIMHGFPRIVFEFGAVRSLPEELEALGIERPLIITDKGLVEHGTLEFVRDALGGHNDFALFDDIPENPTIAGVVAALETTLTDALIAAGYVRDLNREVQMMRKGQDLEVTQRIRVYFTTSDAMAAIVAANVDELKRETLAVEFARKPGLDAGHRAKIGDDEVLIVIESASA